VGWTADSASKNRSGVSNLLHFCEVFIVHVQFMNVAPGRITQRDGPRFGDP